MKMKKFKIKYIQISCLQRSKSKRSLSFKVKHWKSNSESQNKPEVHRCPEYYLNSWKWQHPRISQIEAFYLEANKFLLEK